jgi:hypothetical protein
MNNTGRKDKTPIEPTLAHYLNKPNPHKLQIMTIEGGKII